MPTDPGWRDAVNDAIEAHPGVRLERDEFVVHANACHDRGALSKHLDELFLAWACGRGDANAIRKFDRLVAPDVSAAARRLDSSPSFCDEVQQAVRVRLLVGDDGRMRIDDYVGRGPLRAWVAVVALRVGLNLRRRIKPARPDLLEELVDTGPDPELQHLKKLYRAEFRSAIHEALRSLGERERALLRLCYVDGLRANQVARLYQVHETTASRWLKRAANDVALDARRRLSERLSLSPSSLESVTRMVLSNLELSISRILVG